MQSIFKQTFFKYDTYSRTETERVIINFNVDEFFNL